MPAKKFGSSFLGKAKKTDWKQQRNAKKGERKGKWDAFDPGLYHGSTTVTLGVANAGTRKGQDYVSFQTTVLKGDLEGETVDDMIYFGGEREEQEHYDKNLTKLIKHCKSLFPDLEEDIEQCGSAEAFFELLSEDIDGETIEHEFEVIDTKIGDDEVRYRAFGDLLPYTQVSSNGAVNNTDEDEDEDEDENDDDTDSQESDYHPTVGAYVNFKPPGKKKTIECEVKTCNKRKQTCNLESEEGDKYANIDWNVLTPADDED